MRKLAIFLVAGALAGSVRASWYWPFGSDDEEPEPPRLSELMEPASLAIDEAADLAADGKMSEAVEAYRKALATLDQIERENPERAATPEFASLRNKRAYVSAAIDSILLQEARSNAKAVAITDTTELEKKFAERKGGGKPETTQVSVDHWGNAVTNVVGAAKSEEKPEEPAPKKPKLDEKKVREIIALDPESRKAKLLMASEMLRDDDLDGVKEILEELFASDEKDVAALNIRAAMEMKEGDYRQATHTLDWAIKLKPKYHHSYYNMAQIILQHGGNVSVAKRYYDIGRMVGGERDPELEEALGL
jgi:tetratricopeptide (TPR) repeat protein